MKTLTLPLKRKWFEMIKAGVKLEEYREITGYWEKRFLYSSMQLYKKFDKLVFTLGYPKSGDNSRRIEFNNARIYIKTGRPEWGAEPGKQYFVISWEQ